MSNNLIFKDDVQITIMGEDFSFDSTDMVIIKKIKDFSEEAPKKMDELKDREDMIKAVEEATQYVVDVIDSILGEGACKRIFKDNPVSMLKATQIIDHINEAIIKARGEKAKEYSTNRATRRSK